VAVRPPAECLNFSICVASVLPPGGGRGRYDAPHALIDERAGEAPPVDCRIAVRLACIQQVAVLDEEQRRHDERGNCIEIVVDETRMLRIEKLGAARIEEQQPCPVFFLVWKKEALVRQRRHGR
jgi:hypothetical protein